MITVFVNEKQFNIDKGTTLFQLKNRFKPNADVVILNGHIMDTDTLLNNNDNIVLIKKGEIPSQDELEFLMVARHTPGIHKKLKKGKVAIAGLGGLGSNIATSLARMGVGYIKLIDYDVVEPSNLNRQYYFIDQIGKKKIEALVETLNKINPYITYDPVDCYINEQNIKKLFHNVDVIIEAFDKAESKAMLIKNCMQIFPDKLIIGASGVAGIHDPSLLKIEQLGKNVFIVGDFVNEARPGEGLMATRVAIAANIQANIAVNYLVDKNFEMG